MSGGDTWDERGIIPRSLRHIFRNSSPEHVYLSYFEIYNEQGYDLLDKKHLQLPFEKWQRMNIYEDYAQQIHLRNVTVHEIDCE